MRNSNPIENTGIVIRKSNNAPLGSCFLFRYPEVLLTAAHCIFGVPHDDLAITLPGSRNSRLFDVTQTEAHPSACGKTADGEFAMRKQRHWRT